MNLSFLTRDVGGLPLWAWLAIVGGAGVGLFFFIRSQQGSSSSGALGSNSAGQSTASTDPNLDPNTGVPYSIEGDINPATGLPAYYGGPGVSAPTGTDTAAPGAPTDAGTPSAPAPTPAPTSSTPSTPTSSTPAPKPATKPKPKPAPKPKAKPKEERETAKQRAKEKAPARHGGPNTARGAGPDLDWSATQATPYWPRMTDLEAS